MKILLFCACIFILVLACNKNDGKTLCHADQVQFFTDARLTHTINYEYDDQGRIKRTIDGITTFKYDYFTDSVVVTQTISPSPGYSRITYFLNNAGLASSSKLISSSNVNGSQFDKTYTYDSEGYLTGERQIHSGLYNGIILHDTDYTSYSLINGNIIKRASWGAYGAHELYFEYSALPLLANIPVLNPFPSSEGSFLGKKPTNLLSKTKPSNNGNTFDTISYSLGFGGKVLQMTTTVTEPRGGGGPETAQIHYRCD